MVTPNFLKGNLTKFLNRATMNQFIRSYSSGISGCTLEQAKKSGRKVYDLRSDTITTQPKEMLKAMYQAEVGDDGYGEDPTVRKLEELITEITGKEGAMLVLTGTAACQIAARSVLPPPPASVICHRYSHMYLLQAMTLSYLCGAGYVPVVPDGRPKDSYLKKHDVEAAMFTNNDVHIASTKLVAIENPMNGKIMPLEDAKDIYELCKSKNVPLNLDGSRLWNAHVETGISIAEYAKYTDNITLCFSKGLCCPMGSVIAGDNKTIEKAKFYRKAHGGAWRQAGYAASACIWAINNILPVLHLDNIKAKKLAENLVKKGVSIKEYPETNILYLDKMHGVNFTELIKHLCERGILIFDIGRIVLHYHIPINDIDHISDMFAEAVDACRKGLKSSLNTHNL